MEKTLIHADSVATMREHKRIQIDDKRGVAFVARRGTAGDAIRLYTDEELDSIVANYYVVYSETVRAARMMLRL